MLYDIKRVFFYDRCGESLLCGTDLGHLKQKLFVFKVSSDPVSETKLFVGFHEILYNSFIHRTTVQSLFF